MTAPRPSQGPQGAPDPGATPGAGSTPTDAAEADTALRERMAETLAPLWPTHMSRNVEHHRNQILAAADALLPVVQAARAEQTQRLREELAWAKDHAAQWQTVNEQIERERDEALEALAYGAETLGRAEQAEAAVQQARTALAKYRSLKHRDWDDLAELLDSLSAALDREGT